MIAIWLNDCITVVNSLISAAHIISHMEFGKVTEEELEQIDFTLPPDPSVNKEVLKKGKGKTKFYVGCAKWGRKDWIGKLYPVGTKEKDFLEYYAGIFNC